VSSTADPGEILRFEEYLDSVLQRVRPLAAVSLPLSAAAGRRAAAAVHAQDPAPGFTNSAMDGFAVNTADLPGAGEATLPVSADIPAGRSGTWAPGTAVRIMTGAPLPEGANTVIPVEFTDHPSTRAPLPGAVRVPGDWPAGRNVRVAGSDVRAGEELLAEGTRLDGAALAALAGVGISRVKVWPQVRVGVIVTGDEVVTENPGPGQVLDSNSLLIGAGIAQFGGALTRAHTSSDDPEAFDALVTRTAGEVDLLLTTGGASVGAHDVARHVLSARGVNFSSVGIQPAKPQGFGVIDGVPVAALPGNPGAVHTSLHVIVRPVLAALGHLLLPAPEAMVVTEGWTARAGMRQFVPVRIDGNQITPVIPGGVAAHRVRSLALAEGLASVAPELTEVKPGDLLPVIRTR